MTEQADPETKAAVAAAEARQMIADRITKLVVGVKTAEEAQIVLNLAEAYGHLAAEPPRTRGG